MTNFSTVDGFYLKMIKAKLKSIQDGCYVNIIGKKLSKAEVDISAILVTLRW